MKAIKVIQNCITGVLIVIIVLLAVVFFIPQCLGYQPYNIQTGSMTPKYPVGGMIYVKSVPFEEIAEGDVITYQTAQDGGWVVTHRVTQIDSATQTITTQGDANNTEDGVVNYANVIGKSTDFCIPYVGRMVTEYQSGNGKIITIAGIIFLMGVSFLLDLIHKDEEPEAE